MDTRMGARAGAASAPPINGTSHGPMQLTAGRPQIDIPQNDSLHRLNSVKDTKRSGRSQRHDARTAIRPRAQSSLGIGTPAKSMALNFF